ncbi:hypothetical protein [Pusillimonas minor]|uniref:Uncharacterized protein n=1 Tax=Pusillimonas minor TaxID=2697024 RepID=A0A842HIS4_9BURK|nr:hypothetical protein [Pusillimonas minor]MBC2768549.1 hypothetical protein [Pusillimonas minor]
MLTASQARSATKRTTDVSLAEDILTQAKALNDKGKRKELPARRLICLARHPGPRSFDRAPTSRS